MIYGYARVSTDGQSEAAQVRQLRAAGAKRVFREVASGAKTDQPQLRRVLAGIGPGDVVTVTRLDRRARSTRDLLNTLAAITGKEAGSRSLADGRADANGKGVKFGRKPKLTPHQQRETIRRSDVDGETLRSIGRRYNVSSQTISRLTA
jgi:DNA invertase Pin-like site-specific DNA recombinase